jgi:hypothetical protein
MRDQIEFLADKLMAEGYCDNEADARLAAVHILLASEARRDDSAAPSNEGTEQ